jgi:hypothetical protein
MPWPSCLAAQKRRTRSARTGPAVLAGLPRFSSLALRYQPDRRSAPWRVSIRNARDQIEAIVEDSPTLRRELPEALSREYQKARKYAADETELPLETFPVHVPFSTERIFDNDYLPE